MACYVPSSPKPSLKAFLKCVWPEALPRAVKQDAVKAQHMSEHLMLLEEERQM